MFLHDIGRSNYCAYSHVGLSFKKSPSSSVGAISTNLEVSVISRVFCVVKAGISSENDVISLYEELKNRPATQKDKGMIDFGYKKALEKQ